ncbi:acyl-CoA thioesterase [Nocardia pseudovaccinii]|uniref:acyl-CoA thioesterase n=1 Tax=Nocardia pseudovaccinii TaxID=189540 RepID=UPI0007A51F53|nr:thioesterase family protein [Nocardia pseudovaccinii]
MTSTAERDDSALRIADFSVTREMTTRWSDNDMYGHLNNAVYYELFDAAINSWIIEQTGFDATSSDVLGVVAESGCRYFQQVTYPNDVLVALRIARLGHSSVAYDLGLFEITSHVDSASLPIAARGRWVHVYVDRRSRQPTAVPTQIRALLEEYAP